MSKQSKPKLKLMDSKEFEDLANLLLNQDYEFILAARATDKGESTTIVKLMGTPENALKMMAGTIAHFCMAAGTDPALTAISVGLLAQDMAKDAVFKESLC